MHVAAIDPGFDDDRMVVFVGQANGDLTVLRRKDHAGTANEHVGLCLRSDQAQGEQACTQEAGELPHGDSLGWNVMPRRNQEPWRRNAVCVRRQEVATYW